MKRMDRDKDLGNLRVRLLESAARLPTTPVEQWTVNCLKRGGPTPFSELVNQVADQLYLDEILHGGAALDIGLFGPKLFRSEVATELKAGDGILWKIRQERDAA